MATKKKSRRCMRAWIWRNFTNETAMFSKFDAVRFGKPLLFIVCLLPLVWLTY